MKRIVSLAIFAMLCVGAWLTAQYTPPNSGGGSSGTVTSVSTSSPLTGGPFTTSGTIACATCVTSAASLTSNAIVLGAGSQGSAVLGSLGTTTTLLHGNAAGAPSFGAVSLTADVSGVLPGANGGTGVANTGSTITLGGSLATSGAFTTTFTVTGNTNVTLPTSGTLSTTTGTVTTVGFTGGLITVANATTTPALTVAGTSGGIVFFNTATSWTSSAALAAGGVVLGGGAGTTPATDTHLVYTATNGLNITTNTASGTNGYGLQVAAPTGATNNYAASFTGGQVLITDGTNSLPSIAFTSTPSMGIYKFDAVTIAVPASFNAGGTLEINGGSNAIITTTMSLRGSVGVYGWTSGGVASTGNDTGFSRGGAHIVDVGNGAAGNTTGLLNFAGGTIQDPTATTGASLLTITPGAGQTATSIVLSQSASHSYSVVGAGIIFKAGSNARTGTGTLSGGTLAVANTSITANSQVFIQDTGGGTIANIGNLYVASQTATTGFTVTSTNVLDNSTFRYWIFETN